MRIALVLVFLLFTAGSPPDYTHHVWFPFISGGGERMSTYYISTTGDDGDPGTLAEPWRHISKANSTLVAGDTVEIRVGTYDEIIRPDNNGTSGNRITYTNYQDEIVTVRGELGEHEIVNLNSRSYITIDGLRITHVDDITGVKFGWITMRYAGCEHNLIHDCVLIRAGNPETLYNANYLERGIIVYSAAKYNVIEDNYIRGHDIGIFVTRGPQYTEIVGNTVRHTGISCIVIGTSYSVIQGTLIEDNVIEYSYSEDGIQFEPDYDAGDPSTDVSNRGTIIRNNVIRHNAENAIDLKGVKYVVIEDNLIYGTIGSSDGPVFGWNRNSLATILRGTGTSSEDVIIRNNVIYDNSSYTALYAGYLVYNNTFVSNNRDYTGPDSHEPGHVWEGANHRTGGAVIEVILNNIFVGHYTAEVGIYTVNIHIDYNLYYNSDGELFEDRTADQILNWANWLARLVASPTVTGKDINSVIGDPLFTVAPEHPQWNVTEYIKSDFSLGVGSPAIDAGTHMTECSGGGTGVAITVDDARFFFDGYGIVAGDDIVVGTDEVTITDINYGTDVITVDQVITWIDNDPVSLPYNGAAPDIGALESGGATTTTTTVSTTSTATLSTTSTTSTTTLAPPSLQAGLIVNCAMGTRHFRTLTAAEVVARNALAASLIARGF